MPFVKGKSGNPGGKPKGTKHSMTVDIFDKLLKAIKETKDNKKISKGKDVFEHFVERAYKSDTVLNALMKKFVPDRTFNIEDIRGGDIKVSFELVNAKKKDKQSSGKAENEPDDDSDNDNNVSEEKRED